MSGKDGVAKKELLLKTLRGASAIVAVSAAFTLSPAKAMSEPNEPKASVSINSRLEAARQKLGNVKNTRTDIDAGAYAKDAFDKAAFDKNFDKQPHDKQAYDKDPGWSKYG